MTVTTSRPAGGHRHTVRGVSEKGPAINQGPHQIQNKLSTKEMWFLVLGFVFLSAVNPGFSLILDPIEWEGRLGVLARNLRVAYWVNVSESSGAGSHRLSRIQGH